MARSRNSSGCERKSPKIGGSGSFKESGNSLRRFGQSIKRIVREVEEQSQVSETRDALVQRNVSLNRATKLLHKCYLETLNSMVTLQNHYIEAKSENNIFHRYNKLRNMIKVVCLAESKWFQTSVLPTQCRTDSQQSFVEKSALAILSVTGDEEDRRKFEERLIEMTSNQISEENKVIVSDLYRLIKKYQAIRTIVRILVKEYNNSKFYPIIPRYVLLRDMVKDATHHPDYKVRKFPVHKLEESPVIANYIENTQELSDGRAPMPGSVSPGETVWKVRREYTSKNNQVKCQLSNLTTALIPLICTRLVGLKDRMLSLPDIK